MSSQILSYLRESERHSGRFGATLEGKLISSEGDLREYGFSGAGDPRRTGVSTYQQTLSEVQRLYDKVLRGDRWAALRFQEAMTISDFSGYFGDVIDRQVLANYAETPYSWDAYCRRATLNDFRQTKLFRFDRGAAVLDGPILPNSYGATGTGPKGIEQISEYPMRYRTSTNYTDQLYKFGARMDFAWEVLVNDDLDMLKDTPALFGRACRRTEEKRATQLYVTSSGPNSTFFNDTTHKNVVTNAGSNFPFVTTNNPPLSVTSLAWALQIASMQRDLDGEPISVQMWTLVVPPALDITARNILNATNIWMNDQGGTTIPPLTSGGYESAQRLITANWARDRVRVALNYYLPVVDTSHGNTAWYLFANPSEGRPALQQSFLRSQPMPQMFMKSPNSIAIGEGGMGPGGNAMPGSMLSNPMDGDFDEDAVRYKVRHILGGSLLDPIMAVASNGSGS